MLKRIFYEISLYDVIVVGAISFFIQSFFGALNSPQWGHNLAVVMCLWGVILGLRGRIKDRDDRSDGWPL